MKQDMYIFPYCDNKGNKLNVRILAESFDVARKLFEKQDFQNVEIKTPIYIGIKSGLVVRDGDYLVTQFECTGLPIDIEHQVHAGSGINFGKDEVVGKEQIDRNKNWYKNWYKKLMMEKITNE